MLQIVAAAGRQEAIHFIIDPGSDISLISASWAASVHVPFKKLRRVPVRTFKGHAQGWLSSVTVELYKDHYTWPCIFIEADEQDSPSVIGRAGFLEDFTFVLMSKHFALVPRRVNVFRRMWHRFATERS
jgi:hypothetical protein